MTLSPPALMFLLVWIWRFKHVASLLVFTSAATAFEHLVIELRRLHNGDTLSLGLCSSTVSSCTQCLMWAALSFSAALAASNCSFDPLPVRRSAMALRLPLAHSVLRSVGVGLASPGCGCHWHSLWLFRSLDDWLPFGSSFQIFQHVCKHPGERLDKTPPTIRWAAPGVEQLLWNGQASKAVALLECSPLAWPQQD